MDTHRNVVLDLLPLYLAGEASAESRTLVESHLENDPDMAALAQQWRTRIPEPPPPAVDPDAQSRAFLEAKRQIANRIILVAAIAVIGTLAIAGVALTGALRLFAG